MKTSLAFTLIEVLIVLAIFTVMAGSMYSVLLISQRSWDRYAADIVPKQELRSLLAAMAHELRESRNIFIVTSEQQVKMTFVRPKWGEIAYTWTDQGADARKIIRTNYANQRVMAYNISSVSFSAPQDHEVIVALSTKGGQEFQLKEKIALRAKTGLFAQSNNEQIQ